MTRPETYEHREIIYAGRVQGVGFRATTRSIAERFEVRGFVRNEPDGTVLLRVEGEKGELDALTEAIEAALGRLIVGRRELRLDDAGAYDDFQIRY